MHLHIVGWMGRSGIHRTLWRCFAAARAGRVRDLQDLDTDTNDAARLLALFQAA